MFAKRNAKGATLIEVILVLAIASFILLLSFNQYLSYRRNADVMQLQTNVDMLFGALESYFHANCSNPDSPLSAKSESVSYAVPIEKLMSEGYLVLSNNKMQGNPLVNADSQGQGYILQFNQTQVSGELPTRTQEMTNAPSVSIGSVVLWQAQVAVNLSNPNTTQQYLNILNANCLSNLSGDIVTACNQGPSGGDYVVFERGPSRPSSKANSIYWLNNPNVKLFKQEYTTDPITILVEPSQTEQLSKQYYLCSS